MFDCDKALLTGYKFAESLSNIGAGIITKALFKDIVASDDYTHDDSRLSL